MKRRENVSSSSLDMLLDTMCNTFGGVCFIALLIAIISASLPKDSSESNEEEIVQMAIDEKIEMLSTQRDELVEAVKLQKTLLDNAIEEETSQEDLETVQKLLEDEKRIEELSHKRIQLAEEIKTLATKTNYNKQEAERLQNLSEELKEDLKTKKFTKTRVVRTPQERELQGYVPETVWLIKGRLYRLNNSMDADCEETSATSWVYTPRKDGGVQVTKETLSSAMFNTWLSRCYGKRFVRIFTDSESFSELRMLLDVIIEKKLQYNWRWHEGHELRFVEGSDGQVQ